MLVVLESRLFNSRYTQANGYCEVDGDENEQRDEWNRDRWQGERSEGANVVKSRMRKGD